VEQELPTLPELLFQLRDIYAICRCCWNVTTYKWNVHNVENWNHLFCRNFSFLTDPHGQFSSVCRDINIFVMLGGRVFHQTVDIPIGTNCAPLLTDLFLYVADFIPGLLRKNAKKITLSFNFTFCYIDDFLSLNNSKSLMVNFQVCVEIWSKPSCICVILYCKVIWIRAININTKLGRSPLWLGYGVTNMIRLA
jgi:hypothetical protein